MKIRICNKKWRLYLKNSIFHSKLNSYHHEIDYLWLDTRRDHVGIVTSETRMIRSEFLRAIFK